MSEMHVCMISQPMNGKDNSVIRKEREDVIRSITNNGWECIDTVFDDFDMSTIKNKPVFYLGKSIEKMSECDAVVFMSGWENARGCVMEHMIAEKYGISCFYYDPTTKMIY